MIGFKNWLENNNIIKALPGENLDNAIERAKKDSLKSRMVTLIFNNMRIIFEKGQIRHDLSKLR